MKTLDQVIAKLPASRRRKVAARAEQLIAQEYALRRQLRKGARSELLAQLKQGVERK